jgi:hypothetical protein
MLIINMLMPVKHNTFTHLRVLLVLLDLCPVGTILIIIPNINTNTN